MCTRTGAALIKKLGDTDDFSLDPLEFGLDKDSLLGVIRWGYGAEAKGSGAIALGAINKATLDIAGSGDGLFAVVRRLLSNMPARDIVQTVADSWMLPRQVASIDSGRGWDVAHRGNGRQSEHQSRRAGGLRL